MIINLIKEKILICESGAVDNWFYRRALAQEGIQKFGYFENTKIKMKFSLEKQGLKTYLRLELEEDQALTNGYRNLVNEMTSPAHLEVVDIKHQSIATVAEVTGKVEDKDLILQQSPYLELTHKNFSLEWADQSQQAVLNFSNTNLLCFNPSINIAQQISSFAPDNNPTRKGDTFNQQVNKIQSYPYGQHQVAGQGAVPRAPDGTGRPAGQQEVRHQNVHHGVGGQARLRHPDGARGSQFDSFQQPTNFQSTYSASYAQASAVNQGNVNKSYDEEISTPGARALQYKISPEKNKSEMLFNPNIIMMKEFPQFQGLNNIEIALQIQQAQDTYNRMKRDMTPVEQHTRRLNDQIAQTEQLYRESVQGKEDYERHLAKVQQTITAQQQEKYLHQEKLKRLEEKERQIESDEAEIAHLKEATDEAEEACDRKKQFQLNELQKHLSSIKRVETNLINRIRDTELGLVAQNRPTTDQEEQLRQIENATAAQEVQTGNESDPEYSGSDEDEKEERRKSMRLRKPNPKFDK